MHSRIGCVATLAAMSATLRKAEIDSLTTAIQQLTSDITFLQGELILQPYYEYISYAGEGLFRVEQGDKVGYFDLNGKWVWGLQE